jgi:hypothetical protein
MEVEMKKRKTWGKRRLRKRPLAVVTIARITNWHRVLTIAGDTEVVVVVDVEVLEVVVDEVVVTDFEEVEVNGDDEELVDGGAVPSTTTHCRTTCTKGSPLGPVTGVKVIVHCWVTGPAELQRERRLAQIVQ